MPARRESGRELLGTLARSDALYVQLEVLVSVQLFPPGHSLVDDPENRLVLCHRRSI
jgi:hypothetical protein